MLRRGRQTSGVGYLLALRPYTINGRLRRFLRRRRRRRELVRPRVRNFAPVKYGDAAGAGGRAPPSARATRARRHYRVLPPGLSRRRRRSCPPRIADPPRRSRVGRVRPRAGCHGHRASESSVHAGLDSPPRTRPDARIARMFRSTDGPRQFRHRQLAPWKDPYTSKSERCVTFGKVRRQFSVNKDLYNSLLRAMSVHSVCRLKKYRGRAPD